MSLSSFTDKFSCLYNYLSGYRLLRTRIKVPSSHTVIHAACKNKTLPVPGGNKIKSFNYCCYPQLAEFSGTNCLSPYISCDI
jgi:hypothetical protein